LVVNHDKFCDAIIMGNYGYAHTLSIINNS